MKAFDFAMLSFKAIEPADVTLFFISMLSLITISIELMFESFL